MITRWTPGEDGRVGVPQRRHLLDRWKHQDWGSRHFSHALLDIGPELRIQTSTTTKIKRTMVQTTSTHRAHTSAGERNRWGAVGRCVSVQGGWAFDVMEMYAIPLVEELRSGQKSAPFELSVAKACALWGWKLAPCTLVTLQGAPYTTDTLYTAGAPHAYVSGVGCLRARRTRTHTMHAKPELAK